MSNELEEIMKEVTTDELDSKYEKLMSYVTKDKEECIELALIAVIGVVLLRRLPKEFLDKYLGGINVSEK